MTRYLTILEKYLPPWAPRTPRYARVGDYVLIRGKIRGPRLALVEDSSRDRQQIYIRPWIETRRVWAPHGRWILRTAVVAVVGKVGKDGKPPGSPQDAPG